MTDTILRIIGAVVLVGGGFGLAGLFLVYMADYGWRKLLAAYSLTEVTRVVRKYGDKIKVKP